MRAQSRFNRFFETYQVYGWIINLLVTAVLLGISWGSVTARLEDYGKRIVRIEDFLLNGTTVSRAAYGKK